MRERIDMFVNEIPRNEHVQQLVNKLDLILKIETNSNTFYLAFRDGKVEWNESGIPAGTVKTIAGREEHLEQLFDGDLKLLYGVKMNYLFTDCSFRAQLVLESLFYLARPLRFKILSE